MKTNIKIIPSNIHLFINYSYFRETLDWSYEQRIKPIKELNGLG